MCSLYSSSKVSQKRKGYHNYQSTPVHKIQTLIKSEKALWTLLEEIFGDRTDNLTRCRTISFRSYTPFYIWKAGLLMVNNHDHDRSSWLPKITGDFITGCKKGAEDVARLFETLVRLLSGQTKSVRVELGFPLTLTRPEPMWPQLESSGRPEDCEGGTHIIRLKMKMDGIWHSLLRFIFISVSPNNQPDLTRNFINSGNRVTRP